MFSGKYRTVIFLNGLFCFYLAVSMSIPMAVDYLDSNPDWIGFLASIFIAGSLSGVVVLATQGELEPISLRDGFVLVVSLWISTSAVAILPYLLGTQEMTFTDAVFETVSGITTTGSTVLVGLDDLPHGLLMWRSVTQWLGGIGIIVMGILILPMLRIGGMQLFRMESSERSDKPVSRINVFAVWLMSIYGTLTVLCILSFVSTGMSWFDAVNHAMTTVSTGGFSTSDASFGKFGEGAQIACMVFMLAGAIPFTAFLRLMLGRIFWQNFDSQIPILIIIVLLLSLPVFASAVDSGTLDPPHALLHSMFNILSLLSTTGFATADYASWGPSVAGIFLLATFLGGCAGSTSGGFKTYRLIILAQNLKSSIHQLVYPNGVFPIYYNGRQVSDVALTSVTTFLTAYVGVVFLFTILLGISGLDLVTAFTGTLTAISNVGPGLGPTIGPAGNFASLPDITKWLLILLMLLGRLEIMTVLVLLSPVFWHSD